MAQVARLRTRRFTRAEYERLVDQGFFRSDERLELLDGRLVVREPQGSPHVTAVGLALDALQRAFGRVFHVRVQAPIAAADDSELEPDLAVVRGTRRLYRDTHPGSAVLIVEIADSSLVLDRRRKGAVYARAGVADYWIVNLRDRVLEVYRAPIRAASPRIVWKYRSVRVLHEGGTVSPLAAPAARIRVRDLLP